MFKTYQSNRTNGYKTRNQKSRPSHQTGYGKSYDHSKSNKRTTSGYSASYAKRTSDGHSGTRSTSKGNRNNSYQSNYSYSNRNNGYYSKSSQSNRNQVNYRKNKTKGPKVDKKLQKFINIWNQPGVATHQVSNASATVANILKQKTTRQLYEGLVRDIKCHDETNFSTGIQSYIVHIGRILMRIYGDVEASYYNACIWYICYKICKRGFLYKQFAIFGINNSGNSTKHTLEEIMLWINDCIKCYNQIIASIIENTKIKEFAACYLNAEKPNLRDVPIIKEQLGTKRGSICDVDYKVQLNKYYKIDTYKKTVVAQARILIPQASKKAYTMSFKFRLKGTNEVIASIDSIKTNTNNINATTEISVPVDIINRRVLALDVDVTLIRGYFVDPETQTQTISRMLYEDAVVESF